MVDRLADESRIADLEREIEALQARLAAQVKYAEDVSAQDRILIADLRQRISDIEQSRSWKVTAPYRELGSLARRLLPLPRFGTFWHGPMDAVTFACLASYPVHGLRLTVFSYENLTDVPKGVEVRDAREISPDVSLVDRYFAEGRRAIAKFANLFRYRMIEKNGWCWVDSDMLCLRRPDVRRNVVFGQAEKSRSNPFYLNNAILKLPRSHPMLAELIDTAASVVDLDEPWGVVGPILLTRLAPKYNMMQYARDRFHYYPLLPQEFWKPLLVGHRSEVEHATRHSSFLHLWNENFRLSNYDKNLAPPSGSFLNDEFTKLGVIGRFKRAYSEDELRATLRWDIPA